MSVGRSSPVLIRAPALRLPRTETSRAYLVIAGWWAGSRLFVLLCALVAQVVRWPIRAWHPSPLRHPLVLLGAWDGQWYRLVAEHGYLLIPAQPSDPAFFPLLPVAENGLSVIGIPPIVAGVLVANLGLLVGLLAMYELGRALLPESQARRAAVYLAIFPYGFVFSMAYPEGLALALVALTGLLAVRRHWLGASATVAAATLARPQGVFLLLPVAAAAWGAWGSLSDGERSQAVAAVLAGPAALASFSLYLWHTVGNPMAWSQAEVAWGRSFSLLGPYRAVAPARAGALPAQRVAVPRRGLLRGVPRPARRRPPRGRAVAVDPLRPRDGAAADRERDLHLRRPLRAARAPGLLGARGAGAAPRGRPARARAEPGAAAALGAHPSRQVSVAMPAFAG